MKRLGAIIILLLSFLSFVVFAAGGIKEFSQDILRFGTSGAGIRKIVFDASPDANSGVISVDPSTDQFSINNKLSISDALDIAGNFTLTGDSITMGDGTNTDKSIVLSNGSANPPKIVYNATDSAWTFTNDGTLFKKIGSGSGNGSGGINILQNPGFEDGAARNWTASANITASDVSSGADLGIGEKSSKLVASGAGTYCSDVVTKPNALGFGCQVSFKYKGGSTGHHKMIVYDNAATPNKLTEFDIVHSDVWYEVNTSAIKSFACADQMKLCIETDQADANGDENIVLDEMYLGNNKNFTSIQPSAQFLGGIEWNVTANCEWVGTSTSYSNFSNDNECDDNARILSGNAIDSSNGLRPEVKFPHLKKGRYLIIINSTHITGDMVASYRISVNNTYFSDTNSRWSNGGTALHFPSTVFNLELPDDVDNALLSVQAKVTSGNTNIPSTFSGFYIKLYYYPDKGFEAYYPETSSFLVEGKILGAKVDTVDNGVPSNNSLTLTNIRGNSNITCSDNSQGTTTCSSGNEQLGIETDLPLSGKYEVCFDISAYVNNSSGNELGAKIAEYQNLSNTIIKSGEAVSDYYFNGAVGISTHRNCNIFDISKSGKHTFKIYTRTVGSTAPQILADGGVGGRSVHYVIRMLQENANPPFILNQVSTSHEVGVRINSCFVSDGATLGAGCSDWVSSITQYDTGHYKVVFNNSFSSGNKYLCWAIRQYQTEGYTGNAGRYYIMAFTGSNYVEYQSSDEGDSAHNLFCIQKR